MLFDAPPTALENLEDRVPPTPGLGTGVPVTNPSVVGGLLELLPWREQVVVCRLEDELGTGPSGPLPRVSNSELRTGMNKGNPTV
ncbi:hypothetical protein VNO80_15933 [Phaseolus coccineus]|uniref:Uncharacterized protein n=1 Tax=Phaseolus coccineus TaxID=3886 RepID=A0AAN9R7F9_PHACN